MVLTIASQTPAPGGVLADPLAYYTAVLEPAQIEGGVLTVTFQRPDTSTLDVIAGDVFAPAFAPGWEGSVVQSFVGATSITIQLRPVGGWADPGDYTGPAPADGRITRIAFAGADVFDTPAPQWDFTVGGGVPVLEVLVQGVRRFELAASAWVGLSGALGRRDRVASAQRTGPGVYVLTFAAGSDRELAEYHLSATPLAPVARTATVTVQGSTVTVRTFDAGGAPADANFALAARRA